MNVFYYCYSYQLEGQHEQELLCSAEQMFELPSDLQPALAQLKSAEFDVDQRVADKILAFACQQ
jgi:hypothetical protein